MRPLKIFNIKKIIMDPWVKYEKEKLDNKRPLQISTLMPKLLKEQVI